MVSGSFLLLSVLMNSIAGLFIRRFDVSYDWLVYAFFGYAIGWVILPGVALLIGALPFVRDGGKTPPMQTA